MSDLDVADMDIPPHLSEQHRADHIRLQMLYDYGGVWLNQRMMNYIHPTLLGDASCIVFECVENRGWLYIVYVENETGNNNDVYCV